MFDIFAWMYDYRGKKKKRNIDNTKINITIIAVNFIFIQFLAYKINLQYPYTFFFILSKFTLLFNH